MGIERGRVQPDVSGLEPDHQRRRPGEQLELSLLGSDWRGESQRALADQHEHRGTLACERHEACALLEIQHQILDDDASRCRKVVGGIKRQSIGLNTRR